MPDKYIAGFANELLAMQIARSQLLLKIGAAGRHLSIHRMNSAVREPVRL